MDTSDRASFSPRRGPYRIVDIDMAVSVACLVSTLFILFSVVVGLQSRLLRIARPHEMQTSQSSTDIHSEPEDQPVRYLDAPHVRPHNRSRTNVNAVNYTLYPSHVYTSGMRSFCVMNGNMLNKTRHNIAYSLRTFPYHLCTDVAYCCADIEGDERRVLLGAPTTLELQVFSSLKRYNPFLKTWIFVSVSQPELTRALIKGDSGESWDWFTSHTLRWLKLYAYDAVAITWSPQYEINATASFVEHLRDALTAEDKYLAIIIYLEDIELDSAIVLKRTLEILGPDGVIVCPLPTRPDARFSETYLPYSQDIVERYRKLQSFIGSAPSKKRPTSNNRVCFLLTLAGTALVLDDARDTRVRSKCVGPWTGGIVGAGRVAFEDVCRKSWDETRIEKYAVVATKGLLWTATHSLETLRRLLDALMNDTEGGRYCMGVTDPEWDDISGFCPGGRIYPLTQLVFSSATTYTVRSALSEHGVTDEVVPAGTPAVLADIADAGLP